jgi:iron-sulfur cluster insertion protein
MITLTESAIERLKEIMAAEPEGSKLRVFVQGGGCSGFEYGFTIDSDVNEDDFTYEFDTINVLIDSMSSQYLVGARIDYKEDLMGSSFKIDNPGAESTCGCGSSFAPAM